MAATSRPPSVALPPEQRPSPFALDPEQRPKPKGTYSSRSPQVESPQSIRSVTPANRSGAISRKPRSDQEEKLSPEEKTRQLTLIARLKTNVAGITSDDFSEFIRASTDCEVALAFTSLLAVYLDRHEPEHIFLVSILVAFSGSEELRSHGILCLKNIAKNGHNICEFLDSTGNSNSTGPTNPLRLIMEDINLSGISNIIDILVLHANLGHTQRAQVLDVIEGKPDFVRLKTALTI